MRTFEDILRENPAKTMAVIERNTKTNERGETTISKHDPWASEDVWDEDYERMIRAEGFGVDYRAAN